MLIQNIPTIWQIGFYIKFPIFKNSLAILQMATANAKPNFDPLCTRSLIQKYESCKN